MEIIIICPKCFVVARLLFFLVEVFNSLGEVKFTGFEIILKPVSCTFRAFNVLNVTLGRLNLREVRALDKPLSK